MAEFTEVYQLYMVFFFFNLKKYSKNYMKPKPDIFGFGSGKVGLTVMLLSFFLYAGVDSILCKELKKNV